VQGGRSTWHHPWFKTTKRIIRKQRVMLKVRLGRDILLIKLANRDRNRGGGN
jgi:hypothetical protein